MLINDVIQNGDEGKKNAAKVINLFKRGHDFFKYCPICTRKSKDEPDIFYWQCTHADRMGHLLGKVHYLKVELNVLVAGLDKRDSILTNFISKLFTRVTSRLFLEHNLYITGQKELIKYNKYVASINYEKLLT